MTQSMLSTPLADLPKPEAAARTLSNQLFEHIREMITQDGGCISFDKYMRSCLYEPGLGYYSAGSRKFGEQGDFITAPEISPLFSKCIANQCEQILKELNSGIILELGAGSGIMARDILKRLEKIDQLPTKYWILEISADLKQRQQKLLQESIPHLFERIEWLDALPADTFEGIIIGNEVIDALPVSRFRKIDNQYKELMVGIENDNFIWLSEEPDIILRKLIEELETRLGRALPDKYVSEINPDLKPWTSSMATCLSRGVMLFIDYGYTETEYYHADRSEGSLQCHYRHYVHSDPFLWPGLQDVTASVNFTALAESAHNAGLNVAGYTNQMYFLMASGLEELVSDINEQDIQAQTKLTQQMRKLTLPEEMGEQFKVMALTKEYSNPLSGFSIMDQRVRL